VTWTPDRIDMLRQLASEKLPTRVIAERMGLTRNQVIGKATREGIRLLYLQPGNPTNGTAQVSPPKSVKAINGAAGGLVHKIRVAIEKKQERAKPSRTAEGYHMAFVEPTTSSNCLITDLNGWRCPWPLWDISQRGGFYCGSGKEYKSPYCTYHNRMSCSSEPPKRLDHRERPIGYPKGSSRAIIDQDEAA
jgi:GcrA cell cycle regulator